MNINVMADMLHKSFSDISTLFYPRSVAIIGISRSTPSLGQMILDNIVNSGYNGTIYLVNPKADMIAGRSVTNNIDDIDGDLDVAILLIPPKYIKTTIERLLTKNCRYAIIISAGFNEQQNSDLEMIKEKITIIGPNSMGVFSPSFNASFSPIPITSGPMGYLSQSGSIVVVAQEQMTAHQFGFSAFISLGNKLDLTEMEMLQFFATDDNTSIIAGYLESFSNPKALRPILTTISQSKPVILVKGGRTEEGSKAVSSHTGALAGNFRLTRQLLRSSGVILADTIEQQVATARYIDKFGIQRHHGVVTVSSAGGPGVLAADEIVETGLDLATLEHNTIEKLDTIIPPFGNSHNPIDLVADAGIDRYVDSIKILADDPAVSTFVVIIVNPVLINTDPLLTALDNLDIDQPIICAFLGPDFDKYDHYDNLLVYKTTEEIAQVLSHVHEYATWKTDVSQLTNRSHLDDNSINPFTPDVHSLLQSYGFTYPDTITTTEFSRAKLFFEMQDHPVVLKLDHPQFSHKTDVGGVILDISSIDELTNAWKELQDIYINHEIGEEERQIELQPYYSNGIELVLGIINDDQFGHFILIGAGGTMVEVLDDTRFLPSPTSTYAIRKALQDLTIYPLLEGYRGSSAVDLDQLIDEILRLDQIIHDHPQITELDINPLYILPESDEYVVLDARIAID